MGDVHYFNTMIQPKGFGSLLPLIIIGIIIVLLIVFMFGITYSMKNTTLTLTGKEIIIKSVFYGKKIPLENVLTDEIKSVNLEENRDYDISFKTMGISMPGFKSGWMRLKNGKKALAFITDKKSVAVIPVEEYIVLFSMDNIDDFIKKIRGIKN